MAIEKGLDPLAKASATSIIFKQRNLETGAFARQEIIALIGQYSSSKTGIDNNIPILSTGVAEDEAVRFGFGSPIHLACEKLFPRDGNGAKVPVWIVPVKDELGALASTGAISADGTATSTFTLVIKYKELAIEQASDACGKIATRAQLNPAQDYRGIGLNSFVKKSIRIPVAKGTTATNIIALVKAIFDENPALPFTYSIDETASIPTLLLTCKFKGEAGNAITVEALDVENKVITWAVYGVDITADGLKDGAGNTNIQTALDNLTEEFRVTRLITQNNDETTLDKIQAWGEALRDGLVSQFAVAYHGYEYPESETVAGTIDVQAIADLGDGRNLDAVNVMIGNIYEGELRSLTYAQRDYLVKRGISNIEREANGNISLRDVVTFFHKQGVQNSIFAEDVSITKIGNIANDLREIFQYSPQFQSAILIANGEITNNPEARSINDIKAVVNSRIETYGLSAWLTNIAEAKELTVVEIDSNNPNRVNINIFGQLTATLRITDIVNKFGFYFGS